jgi:hypothetical protein
MFRGPGLPFLKWTSVDVERFFYVGNLCKPKSDSMGRYKPGRDEA